MRWTDGYYSRIKLFHAFLKFVYKSRQPDGVVGSFSGDLGEESILAFEIMTDCCDFDTGVCLPFSVRQIRNGERNQDEPDADQEGE